MVSLGCETPTEKPQGYCLPTEIKGPPEEEGVVMTNTFWSVICDTILLFSSVLPMATNKFPKCVEQSVKVPNNVIQ
jgi:hypothetical protein